MKQVCTDSVILLVVCVLMQGVFRTEGLVSTLCSAAVPADCLSRTGGTVSLSSVVADHIAWDFDLDEPSGLYALRVNNSADCLEANTSISFAVCSTASHIWDVEAFSSSTDLTFSQGISGECSRLSSNVSADVGLVPCTEESVNTAWVVQGELLTSLVPSTSPTFQPTVPSPSGPKPFEPFSTPFRIAYQSTFVILAITLVYLIAWKFELLPSWLRSDRCCNAISSCSDRKADSRRNSLTLI